jgi:hypothetical protein
MRTPCTAPGRRWRPRRAEHCRDSELATAIDRAPVQKYAEQIRGAKGAESTRHAGHGCPAHDLVHLATEGQSWTQPIPADVTRTDIRGSYMMNGEASNPAWRKCTESPALNKGMHAQTSVLALWTMGSRSSRWPPD